MGINRGTVLNLINDVHRVGGFKDYNSYSYLFDQVDTMPESKEDAEPHWIPVTERLPEKSGRYFVTERIYHINDKEHTGGFILKTDFAEYSATEKKWRRAQALVVVAWMDNEPYKGVTE